LTMLSAAVEHLKGFYVDGDGTLRRMSRRVGEDLEA